MILWDPNEKRDPDAKLDRFWGIMGLDALIKSELITIQGKKGLMATWAGTHEARYFLDDYTEVIISGDVIDWSAQEFKAMLSTVKITPPEGYY
jgi:hypothetical protein